LKIKLANGYRAVHSMWASLTWWWWWWWWWGGGWWWWYWWQWWLV